MRIIDVNYNLKVILHHLVKYILGTMKLDE